MHVWLKVKTLELEDVDSSHNQPPQVLVDRDKRRAKYISQLVRDQTGIYILLCLLLVF